MNNNIQKHYLIYVSAITIFIILSISCTGTNISTKPNTIIAPQATTNKPITNLLRPGTYMIGTDIQPGYYKGLAGNGVIGSCYWARLKDLSGSIESILANDNGIGKYYIHVKGTDYALETKCQLTFLKILPAPANGFPQKITPGTYLVGIDIQFGTYKGQAGTDIMESCYWARLNDVSGDAESVIANDNAIGQFYVQVQQNDFALTTKCELDRVSG